MEASLEALKNHVQLIGSLAMATRTLDGATPDDKINSLRAMGYTVTQSSSGWNISYTDKKKPYANTGEINTQRAAITAYALQIFPDPETIMLFVVRADANKHLVYSLGIGPTTNDAIRNYTP